nr:peptidoglycan DD-metalloendopeptidase family protein [Tissierella sp.]
MQKNKIRKISTVLLMSIIISTGTTSFADKINDLRKEQEGIKNELKTKQEKIKDTQNKTKTVEEQIDALDRKVNKASLDLSKVEGELTTLEENIEKNLVELAEAEKILAEKQENFEERITVMYMNGNVGYLELLLTSKDIKDFFSRKDMVKFIAEQDKELLQIMKEQKEIIEEKKVELAAQRASLSAVKTKLESRKKDLETATRQKQDLMSRLQKDVATFEKEYDKLNDFAKSVGDQILKLQEEQRLREEARIRAEAKSKAEAERKLAEAKRKEEAASNSGSSSSGSTSGSSSSPNVGGKMTWPVPSSSRISSYFGYRIHPIFHTKKLHTGLDIPAPAGANVVAATSGTVIYSGWLGSYGNTVMIDHGGGIVTLYGHNSSTTVSVGQSVGTGSVIAKVGSTGNSTGPHSHFEVRQNGEYIDPLPWVRGN